jgi:hypothetical protein
VCVKKGKWYDCLRPVPGYKDFGGIGVGDREPSANEEDDSHLGGTIQDYSTKTPSLPFGKSKAKKTSN